jgi:hypothetical protein
MTGPPNAGSPARAGSAAEPGDCHRRLASDNNRVNRTKTALNQAENTVIDAARRFRRTQARRHPALTVQINVRAANQPYGKSRPFSLSTDALDRLLDTIAQLEDGGRHG